MKGRGRRGFILAELVVVLAILGVLTSSLLVSYHTLLKLPAEQTKILAVSGGASHAAEWIARDAECAKDFIPGISPVYGTFVLEEDISGNPIHEILYRYDEGDLIREETIGKGRAEESSSTLILTNLIESYEDVTLSKESDLVRGAVTATERAYTAPGGKKIAESSSIFAQLRAGKLRHHWVVDDKDVYRYNAEGLFLDSWELIEENCRPEDITTDGKNIWVVDKSKVFKYHMWGGYMSSWDLYEEENLPRGIATNCHNIWIVDHSTNSVYEYDLTGSYQGSWPLHSGNNDPQGIATDDSHIWVIDEYGEQSKVYKYTMEGSYVSMWDLDNKHSQGIASDGQNFWVVDGQDKRVYVYNISGVLVTSWGLHEENDDPLGITSNG